MEHIREIIGQPLLSIPLGIGGFAQSFITWSTPLVRYIILIATLIIVLNSCIRIFFPKKGGKK